MWEKEKIMFSGISIFFFSSLSLSLSLHTHFQPVSTMSFLFKIIDLIFFMYINVTWSTSPCEEVHFIFNHAYFKFEFHRFIQIILSLYQMEKKI